MIRLLVACAIALFAFASPAFAQGQPQVTITAPANGATVTGPDVTVSINVTGTTLVPAASATKREDLHVHYVLDRDVATLSSGAAPIPMGDANIVHSGALSNTFSNVPAGRHTVAVIVGYADHIAVQPPVAPTVTFTVAGAGAAPTQLPSTGEADPGAAAPLLMLAGAASVLVGLGLGRLRRSGLWHRR
jgi:LPXTG cell wall anchor motif